MRYSNDFGTWKSKGIDHKESDCGHYIERTIPNGEKSWVIEIISLEDLILFCKKYDRIVFDGKEIEIYDDYRE